jgi:hypothetical protein
MARVIVASHKQSGQALIFQITPDKFRSAVHDLLPRYAGPDVRNLPEPLCQDAGMRPIKHNERYQCDAVGQPCHDYAKETALCGREEE